MRRKRTCTAHLLESPEDGNGRERGRISWAAEGRANESQCFPVAWDGSLRYRAGECWLSVRGFAASEGRRAKQARWHRRFEFLDSVLVDEHTGTGSFCYTRTKARPAGGAGFYFICRPLQGRSNRYENHEHDLPPQFSEGGNGRRHGFRSGPDRLRLFGLGHCVRHRLQRSSFFCCRQRGRADL